MTTLTNNGKRYSALYGREIEVEKGETVREPSFAVKCVKAGMYGVFGVVLALLILSFLWGVGLGVYEGYEQGRLAKIEATLKKTTPVTTTNNVKTIYARVTLPNGGSCLTTKYLFGENYKNYIVDGEIEVAANTCEEGLLQIDRIIDSK